jgi:hypothetical protein
MKTLVVLPMGAHPFHPGHLALYQSAQRAFPDAEVYVAATNDTSARPFPFPVKEKLAKLAGVEPGHFVQVKSPFRAEEITARFDPKSDRLIFVRSEKDADKPPQAGGVKRDGSPSYLQPLLGAKKLEPFAKHAYMAYLPTVEFGPGMTSATQIRTAWPTLDQRRKTALVMSLYPRTQGNAKLAATVVRLLDAAIGGASDVAESVEFMSDAQFYGEILSVLAAMGAGLATGAYLKARDIVKMYNADRIMRALEGYRVGNISDSERQALTKLIAEFKQAMAQRQGEQALAIAKQIKTIATDRTSVAEGWKDVVAGGAMALAAMGSGAQSMPDINAQQVELTNKYYKVLVQRAVEDGRTLDARTKNFLMSKAQDAAAQKIQKSTAQTAQTKPQFPAQGSEQRRAKDFDQFESADVDENQGWAATLETVSATGTTANTSGSGAGMTASYQRRDNQPISEDYLSERRL